MSANAWSMNNLLYNVHSLGAFDRVTLADVALPGSAFARPGPRGTIGNAAGAPHI